jgi:integrase
MRNKVRNTIGIYREPSGRYSFNYRDAGGRLHWKTVGTNLDEAKAARAELVIAKRDNTLPSGSRLTVSELAALWLAEQRTELAPNTYATRKANLRVHVIPILGTVRARDLSAQHVWRLVLALRAKNLARSTQRLIVFGTLGLLCNWAIDSGHLTTNPVKRLSKAQRSSLHRESADGKGSSVKTLSNDETASLLAASPARYRLLFTVLVATGLRLSEGLGLRWRDVDSYYVHVRGQLDCNSRTWTIRTKSQSSKRSVVLAPELRAILDLERAVSDVPDDALIFVNEEGRGFAKCNVQRAFKSALANAGLDQSHTVHSLRHSFASHLIENGRPVTVVQAQLGHSTPAVTLNTYSHLFDRLGQEEAVRDALSAFVSRLALD